jgi:protein-tyrosine-phosphatase
MTPEARAYVRRATGTVLPHRARPLRPLDVRQADLVLAMTTQVLSTVSRMAPAMTHRMPTLCVAADAGSSVWHGDRDIADAFGCGAAAYGRVGDRISVAVDAVAAGLRVGVMKAVSDVRATL